MRQMGINAFIYLILASLVTVSWDRYENLRT